MSAIIKNLKAEPKVIGGINVNAIKIFDVQRMAKTQQWIHFFLTNFFKKLFFLSSL